MIDLMEADAARLRYRNAYNVTAMSVTPAEIAAAIRGTFRASTIDYEIDPVRQAIADSWPRSLDDSAAHARLGLGAALRSRGHDHGHAGAAAGASSLPRAAASEAGDRHADRQVDAAAAKHRLDELRASGRLKGAEAVTRRRAAAGGRQGAALPHRRAAASGRSCA